MSGSVNKVILVGNLGADPEIRHFPDGSPFCNLSIATTETWRDRNTGDRRERTEWHRVVIKSNEHLCKFAEQYLHKGRKVYVEGQLQTRKWQDQSGQDRYSTEVLLSRFNSVLTMLDSRRDADDASRGYGEAGESGADGGSDKPASGGGAGLDDDIPF